MIFKGKKTKVFSVAGATLVMLAFSTSALAAIPYTTVTTYNSADNTVSVTSTVTLTTADEVAYLVQKDGATSEDPKIIFIDQKPSVANVALPFSFKTSVDNVNTQATVKFGAMTTTGGFSAAQTQDSTLQIGVKNITVNSGANGNVVASKTTLFDGEGVIFTISPAENYELDTATQNVTNTLTVTGNSITLTDAQFANGDVFNFTFKSTTQVPTITTPSGDQIVPNADADAFETVALEKTPGWNSKDDAQKTAAKRTSTIFAKANPGTGNKAVSYGMLFSKNQASLAALTEDAAAINALTSSSVDIKKFASYGSNALGQFAIRLIDGGSGLLQSDYYTRTYIIYEPTAGGAQTAILGSVVTVSVN